MHRDLGMYSPLIRHRQEATALEENVPSKYNKKIKFASKNTLAGTRKKPRAPYLKRYTKRKESK